MGFLKDIFFPKICLGCGALGTYLCFNCRGKLVLYKNKNCFLCKKPSYKGITHYFCLKKLPINGLFSVFLYTPFFKKIVKNIKYRLVKEIFDDLFKSYYPFLINDLGFYKNLFKNSEIQPIPLSKKRYNFRGFNQAQIFANFLSKIFNLPVVDYLEKKKETPFLSQIKKIKKRFFIIKGAFKVKNSMGLNNKKIVLVDDILTTGSTVKEASCVLKRLGVQKIYVFTLARS